MPKEPDFVLCCKVVVLGDSGVGKTSLSNRWINGTFTDTVKPTIGANHQRKRLVIDGQNLDVFRWDTAGQEQFRSLAPVYTRSSSAVIIVTSCTEIQSFLSIDSWIEIVRNTSERMPPLILAVNKTDLNPNAENSEELSELIEKYQKHFVGVFFCSALTGDQVDNVFRCASESAYKFISESQELEEPEIKPLESRKNCC